MTPPRLSLPGKPIGSIRLSNIADGIEDWELFNALGKLQDSSSHCSRCTPSIDIQYTCTQHKLQTAKGDRDEF